MNTVRHSLSLAGLAEVISELAAEIEDLGASLCRDPAFAHAHMADLQAIDHIAQKQRSIAELLVAECPKTAIAGIVLEDFKARLGMLHSAALHDS